MENLIINKRPSVNDDFKAILSYDSRYYGLGVKFAGFQLYLNNDANPFVTLLIDKKQKWSETIDFTKYLTPGTYSLKLRSFVWTGGSKNKTSCIFFLKVGNFKDIRVYPAPSIPTEEISEPEIKDHILSSLNQDISLYEEHWDSWTVDYGI